MTAEQNGRRCGLCDFWDSLHGEYGQCRAAPPVMAGVLHKESDDPEKALWPETRSRDWCGRFAPDPAKASAPVATEAAVRKAFEQWAQGRKMSTDAYDGVYVDEGTRVAFVGWLTAFGIGPRPVLAHEDVPQKPAITEAGVPVDAVLPAFKRWADAANLCTDCLGKSSFIELDTSEAYDAWLAAFGLRTEDV